LLCWLWEVARELANSSTPGPSLDLKSSVPDPFCKQTESESDSGWVDVELDQDLRKEEDALLHEFFRNGGVGTDLVEMNIVLALHSKRGHPHALFNCFHSVKE
jgi:hypothetical protein